MVNVNRCYTIENYQKSAVAQWYSGKNILITGATGFMAKVLLEKLLRSCPEIETIFLIIRFKKEVDPNERLQNIFKIPLFDILRKINPEFHKKVVLIRGNLSEPNLGISDKDRNVLAQNVSVVFHAAATVKFDSPLKNAVDVNVIGTQKIIELCYKMQKLEAFVYLSTAYSNCDKNEIEENVYECPTNLDNLLKCIECLDNDMLEELKKRLNKSRPNIYSFTKAIAENIVFQHSKNLPVIIARPAIVVGSWVEPFPGWVENLNGPAGIFLAIGKGLLRNILGNPSARTELIPVDISINIIICAAWKMATSSSKACVVYNCVSPDTNPVTWGELNTLVVSNYRENPLDDPLWYPQSTMTKNVFRHEVSKILFHVLPAKIIDFGLKIFQKEALLSKPQKQINSALTAMSWCITNEWTFHSSNVKNLYNCLSNTDKELFNINFENMNWADFIKNYNLGIKQYFLKEKLADLSKARKRLSKLKFIYYSIPIVFFLIFSLVIFFNWKYFSIIFYYLYEGLILMFFLIYYYIYL